MITQSPELTLLDESGVRADEIDSLGHLSVPYYLARADRANARLLSGLGVVPQAHQRLRRIDTYSRFRNEQFEGAQLVTLGGLVDDSVSGIDGISAYFEIRNPEKDQLAASFILTSVIIDRATQRQVVAALPEDVRAAVTRIAVPDHGLPRSLSMAAPRPVTLDELEAAIAPSPAPGMMSGRAEAELLAEDCDELGWPRDDTELMFLLHRRAMAQNAQQAGPTLLRDDQGRRYSWAMMETRAITWQPPRAGDHIVSIGADVGFSGKIRQARRWMFNRDTGALLGTNDSVGVCIDLDARRAIEMPADVLKQVEASCLPQFA